MSSKVSSKSASKSTEVVAEIKQDKKPSAKPIPTAPQPAYRERPAPTKSEIKEFIEKNFKPSLNLATPPKTLDPVIDLYNYAPTTFPFAQDNGKSFKLTLIPAESTEVKEKDEKAAFNCLLRLHSEWIRFTDPYEGNSRIYCTITRKEIVPMYSEVRNYYAAHVFAREWKTKPGKKHDPRIAKANLERRQAKNEAKLPQSTPDGDEEVSRDAKKVKKDDKKSKKDDELVQLGYSDDELPMNRNNVDKSIPSAYSDNEESPQSTTQNGQKRRYIVFVGNLEYHTSPKDLEKLFEKCEIIDIRMNSDKLTKQSKGFAFIEFANSGNVHHALGYDQHDLRGRKINVELSAGGGGNSKLRRSKIETKRNNLAQEKLQRFNIDAGSYKPREKKEYSDKKAE